MIWLNNDRGVSIIAAIFIIVVLAFMGVMFLSMVDTGSLSSVNDLQSNLALSVGEGGVEFAQLSLAQNLEWYRSAADPVTSPIISLGGDGGSFTVASYLPATMLRKRLLAAEVASITVYTTDRFPIAGVVQISDDAGLGNGEFVRYTGKTATTFTGLTRGVTYVGGTLGQGATTYGRGTGVYPVVTLLTPNPLPGNCTPVAITLTVSATNNKLLSAGTVNVYDRTTLDSEEISYTGSSTTAGVMTLTGVQRCQNGTTAATANANDPVTPINNDGALPDYEAEIVSSGSVGNALRIVRKVVQR